MVSVRGIWEFLQLYEHSISPVPDASIGASLVITIVPHTNNITTILKIEILLEGLPKDF